MLLDGGLGFEACTGWSTPWPKRTTALFAPMHQNFYPALSEPALPLQTILRPTIISCQHACFVQTLVYLGRRHALVHGLGDLFCIFFEHCTPFIRACIHNTQLCRQAWDAAEEAAKGNQLQDEEGSFGMELTQAVFQEDTSDTDEMDPLGLGDFPLPFVERPDVLQWADDGVRTGMKSGLIPALQATVHPDSTSLVGVNTDSKPLEGWLAEMDEFSETVISSDETTSAGSASYIIPDFDPLLVADSSVSERGLSVDDIRAPLNLDQRLAFDVVAGHLDRTLGSPQQRPHQLLFKCLGAPGTGKSRLIEAITDLFSVRGASHKLQKTAHQGSAASIIGGTTIFSLLSLRVDSKKGKTSSKNSTANWQDDKLSSKVRDALVARTQAIEYLIIDEISSAYQSKSETVVMSSSLFRSVVRCSPKFRATWGSEKAMTRTCTLGA